MFYHALTGGDTPIEDSVFESLKSISTTALTFDKNYKAIIIFYSGSSPATKFNGNLLTANSDNVFHTINSGTIIDIVINVKKGDSVVLSSGTGSLLGII